MSVEVGEPPPGDPLTSVKMDCAIPPAPTNKLPNLYLPEHQGPYVVIVVGQDGQVQNLHPMRLGKELYGNRAFPLLDIAKKGRNRLELTFATSKAANSFLQADVCTRLHLRAFIPFERTSVIGIARGIPIEFSDEEILTQGKTAEGFPVKELYRFKRRVSAEDGTSSLVPTQTVKFIFHAQVLPARIYLYGATAPLEKYIPPIKQCHTCLNYGHLAKFCRQQLSCLKCGDRHDVTECKQEHPQCKHCSLRHFANDRLCPHYILQTKLVAIMAEHNLSYFDAQAVHRGNKSVAEILRTPRSELQLRHPPSLTERHFPFPKSTLSSKRRLPQTPSQDNSYDHSAYKQILLTPHGRGSRLDARRPSSSVVPPSGGMPTVQDASPPPALTTPSKDGNTSVSESNFVSIPPTVGSPTSAVPNCPSFKLLDMDTFTGHLEALRALQKELPLPFQQKLQLLIKNIK